MKRTSAAISNTPKTWKTDQSRFKGDAIQKPSDAPPRLSAASAGQRVMDVLNTDPPSAHELAPLFREMNAQGIHLLKLSGQISDQGYDALLQFFSFHRPILRNEIQALDFSHTEFPQLSSLLKLFEEQMQLESIDFSYVDFPSSKGSTTRKPSLQVSHLATLAKIVEKNGRLTCLCLNGARLMGSDARSHALFYVREAPLFKLLSACAKAPQMGRLELRDCHLTERDLDNVQRVFDQPAEKGGRKPLGALKSLDLSGDQQADTYQWKHLFRSLARHAHLQTLSLPDGVTQYVLSQSPQVRQEIAQDIASCPQLTTLTPAALANVPEIWQAMLRSHTRQQMELLQHVTLIARSYPGMHNVALGLTLQAVNNALELDPDNLPKKLDFPPAKADFKMPVCSPTTGTIDNS